MSQGHPTPQNPDAPSWVFENISELSKHTRTIHTIQIGFLIYCAFTVFTTADRKIVLDEQAHLPIINLDVPFSGFVLAAPVVALFLFVDFQIHLQALKSKINRARSEYADFPRGRLYPWFGNLAEDPEPGLLGLIQKTLATVSLWLLFPSVLIMLTIFTFKKHNAHLNTFQCVMSCVGSCLALWLWHRYSKEERRPPPRSGSNLQVWINGLIQNWIKVLCGVILAVTQLILILMISDENRIKSGWFSVDLSNQVLVKEQKGGASPYRADLKYLRLDGANLSNSILTEADLEGAELQRAVMQLASLDGANLKGAHLNGASLCAASLKQAGLVNADLKDANLNCANLTNADFHGATLEKAVLVGADLTGARNLSLDQLSKTASLFNATLDKALHDQLCAARPDLFQEPVSLEAALQIFPPDAKRRPLAIAGQIPWEESPESIKMLSQRTNLVLSKSGAESFLHWVRSSHTQERRLVQGYGYVTEEIVRPVQLSTFRIPCYQGSWVASLCK